MDVDTGSCGLRSTADVEIGLAREARMDAALQADLGRPAVPGFRGTAGYFVQVDDIRGPAQVIARLALGKGAERAVIEADVGVVDIPGDDVGDGVADLDTAQFVGGLADSLEVGVAGPEERYHVVFRQPPAVACPVQDTPETVVGRRAPRRGRSGEPFRRRYRRARGPRLLPIVVTRVTVAVGMPEHVPDQLWIDPVLPGLDVPAIDGQSRYQVLAGLCGDARKPLQAGPRRLGVDVIHRNRRDAAPVVDAGIDELLRVRAVQVRRRLDAHVRTEHLSGHGDRPQQLLACRRGSKRHFRARLGHEVLHDDLLDMPVFAVQVPQREQAVETLRPRFADPDEDAAGERHPRPPGGADRLQAHLGILVR